MTEIRIAAQARTEFGKGAARRVRRSGQVPAVVYGHGQDPRHVSLPGHELMLALKTSNALIELEIDGAKGELVLPKSVQRDALKGFLEHVDFVLVSRDEKVVVEIAVEVTGVPADGGVIELVFASLTVEAAATRIPEGVTIDLNKAAPGSAVHAKDFELPAGTTLVQDPEDVIVQILAPKTAEETEEVVVAAATEGAEA